jgi:hypothetical protein
MKLQDLVTRGEVTLADVRAIARMLFGDEGSVSNEIANDVLGNVTHHRMVLPTFASLPEDVQEAILRHLLQSPIVGPD